MGLACNKCGSREAFACNAKDLADKTGDASFMTARAGLVADPVSVLALVGAVVAAAKAVFEYLGWRERNNPTVVVCRACGYWERVTT